MKVLVLGSGGREHCMAWALAKSPRVEVVYGAPGNAGVAQVGPLVDLDLAAPFEAVVRFVKDNGIDLVAVGPEDPLAGGVVDALEAAEIRVFGPRAAAARIEASKAFAKDVMNAAGAPTGRADRYDSLEAARRGVEASSLPLVIKYDALAAGKGVTIHTDREDAHAQLRRIFEEKVFGSGSPCVLIEEFLEGPEASVLAFVDGQHIAPMIAAQDHKPVGEGDKGPNTGGMGAYAPASVVTPELGEEILSRVLRPTVEELARRGIEYKGVLYAGLMITKDGPKVIEFNCRFGDPEAQVVLPLLETDLLDVMEACVDGRLDEIELRWRPGYAMTVVGASPGYPGSYPKGLPVEGLDAFAPTERRLLFVAGAREESGRVVTSGGRVLNAVAIDDDLRAAREGCHAILGKVRFKDMYFRRDIGYRVLG